MAYVTVNGSVEQTFYEGKGARIKESFTKRDGEAGAAYYSAFFEQEHGLNVGDEGKFSGLLGVKSEEYDGKHFARVTLNNTKAENIVSADGEEAPF